MTYRKLISKSEFWEFSLLLKFCGVGYLNLNIISLALKPSCTGNEKIYIYIYIYMEMENICEEL